MVIKKNQCRFLDSEAYLYNCNMTFWCTGNIILSTRFNPFMGCNSILKKLKWLNATKIYEQNYLK